MAQKKFKETKQEPGTAGPDNMLGCCLISFHFLWAILSTSTVHMFYLKAMNIRLSLWLKVAPVFP